MDCNKTYEFANGHTTTGCVLPKGHKGDCKGFIIGMGCECRWDGRYDTEEQEYYKNQVNFDYIEDDTKKDEKYSNNTDIDELFYYQLKED